MVMFNSYVKLPESMYKYIYHLKVHGICPQKNYLGDINRPRQSKKIVTICAPKKRGGSIDTTCSGRSLNRMQRMPRKIKKNQGESENPGRLIMVMDGIFDG